MVSIEISASWTIINILIYNNEKFSIKKMLIIYFTFKILRVSVNLGNYL